MSTSRSLLAITLFVVVLWGVAGQALSAADEAAQGERHILHWVGCGISKKAYMRDVARAFEEDTGNVIKIAGGGSTRGIRDTASGKSELGGSCRPPIDLNPAEAAVESIPIAWDALVVIANKASS